MIREIMTSGESLEAIADNLIRAANNNGGSDNITVVLVQAFADQIWTQPSSQPSYGGAYYG
jgi:serine/threonine protein phosphatase PrpC